jgi:ATP synthase protein I
VGIAIGGAMGYGVDWLLGTLPAFTLVLGLLGFAAGVRVMLRSAQEVNRPPRGEAEEQAAREAGKQAAREAGEDGARSGGKG